MRESVRHVRSLAHDSEGVREIDLERPLPHVTRVRALRGRERECDGAVRACVRESARARACPVARASPHLPADVAQLRRVVAVASHHLHARIE